MALVQRGEATVVQSDKLLDKTYGGPGCRFGVSPEVTYTEEERLFIKACERYVKKSGHKFPTFTEILAVARAMGYRRAATGEGGRSGGS
jgi:hypothetical protein